MPRLQCKTRRIRVWQQRQTLTSPTSPRIRDASALMPPSHRPTDRGSQCPLGGVMRRRHITGRTMHKHGRDREVDVTRHMSRLGDHPFR